MENIFNSREFCNLILDQADAIRKNATMAAYQEGYKAGKREARLNLIDEEPRDEEPTDEEKKEAEEKGLIGVTNGEEDNPY